MFGLSFAELAVIGIVALLVLGPERLPEFARNFGKLTRSLKRQTDSLRREWYNAVYLPMQETKKFVDHATQTGETLKQEIVDDLQQFTDSGSPPSEESSKVISREQTSEKKE